MINGIKKFVKRRLMTDSHPFLRSLISYAREQLHSHMSYAGIEATISRKYEAMYGRPINWENPQTYNEKINVSKLYMPSPLKARLADKVAVREWIAEKIGGEYLVPLIGVYDSFDDIDFDALPDKFVMKCNHDSGTVTPVKDKSKLNIDLLRRRYDLYLRRNWAWAGFEMHYRDIPPKIVIDQYIQQNDGGLMDYKVHCFNGKPEFIQVIGDRDFRTHGGHQRNYTFDWQKMSWIFEDYPEFERELDRPECLDDIYRCSKILCDGFDYVRIDFYALEGRVLFGEMTFTPANGSYRYQGTWTEELDYKLGELWPFDNTARAKILAQHSRP